MLKKKLSSPSLLSIYIGFILYIISFNIKWLALCSRRVVETGVKVIFCGVLTI